MAGYVKIWTQLTDDPKFLCLSMNERGGLLQLMIQTKKQRDNGRIFTRNMSALAQDWACEMRTARKVLVKLQEIGWCSFEKHPDNTLEITLHNYREFQEIDTKEMVKRNRISPVKLQPLRPDQTKPNQTRAEHSINPHKDFLEFIKKNKKRIFDRLSQIAFRILGSEQELWDRTVLGTVVTWIRENPEKANASLARVHSGDWLLFIERWIWRDWKKKNAEIDAGRGMSHKEEQDHYRDKARSGLEPLPAAVSEIVKKVFKKEMK